MTFKGIFRDGVIIPDEGAVLRNGDTVEIRVRKTPKAKSPSNAPQKSRARRRATGQSAVRATRKRLSGEQRLAMFLRAFGTMKNKPEWQGRSSAEIAREIRITASRSRARG